MKHIKLQNKLRENHTRHIIIKLLKIKNKEKILKAAREKQHIIYNLEDSGTTFLKCFKKSTINREVYI